MAYETPMPPTCGSGSMTTIVRPPIIVVSRGVVRTATCVALPRSRTAAPPHLIGDIESRNSRRFFGGARTLCQTIQDDIAFLTVNDALPWPAG